MGILGHHNSLSGYDKTPIVDAAGAPGKQGDKVSAHPFVLLCDVLGEAIIRTQWQRVLNAATNTYHSASILIGSSATGSLAFRRALAQGGFPLPALQPRVLFGGGKRLANTIATSSEQRMQIWI